MWAAFTFFHQSKPAFWTRTPLEALQTAAAIFVLFRPTSLSAFLALVFLQLADLLYTLPYITNHSMFAMFVNLTIALAVLVHAIRNPGVALQKGRLLRLFAPALRIQVLILYFYVVLHKLNADFLNIAASCAVDHSLHLSAMGARVVGYNLFPDSDFARMGVIASTLMFEAAIPLLLLWSRTRIAGVALGLLFHYILGVNIFHDFSGMIFALYLLFLPANFAERAIECWKSFRARVRHSLSISVPGGGVPAGVWLAVAAISILVASGNTWGMMHPIFFGIWVLYGLLVMVIFSAVLYSQRSAFQHAGREFRSHGALLTVALLVFLNGLAPYVGLKTENSFAMYSNLRTEGGRNNHLLIPDSFQLFGFQKDLVTIKSSSDELLRGIADRGTAIPYFVLRTRISALAKKGSKNIQVVYTRAGVERALINAELDPELSARYPWIWRKLLTFRQVDLTPQQMCRH